MRTHKLSKHYDMENTLYTLKIYNDFNLVLTEKSYSLEYLRVIASLHGVTLPDEVSELG